MTSPQETLKTVTRLKYPLKFFSLFHTIIVHIYLVNLYIRKESFQ